MKRFIRFGVVATLTGVLCTPNAWAAAFTIDFDSLATLGPTDQSLSFADANGGSKTFNGVTFESDGFRIIGDNYRVGGAAPNPAMGVPHSGHFFLNNGNAPNDDVIINTSNVLTEAWFGRNEYYGYGGGASSLTVTAFGLIGDLGSVTVDLPDTFASTGNLPPPNGTIGNGLPDPMVRMDTSGFLSLLGITGYRISRVETAPLTGDWVADDFTFASPAVVLPTPSSIALLTIGLLGFAWEARRRTV